MANALAALLFALLRLTTSALSFAGKPFAVARNKPRIDGSTGGSALYMSADDANDLNRRSVLSRDMEKLRTRFENDGLRHFRFVQKDSDPMEDGLAGVKRFQDEILVFAKTIVWEASFTRTSRGKDNVGPGVVTEEVSHYFVTVLRASGRVDQKLLKDYVVADIASPNKDGGRVAVRIADEASAEYLTGFTSGTMPPFGHTIPMKTYMDTMLIEGDGCDDGLPSNENRPSDAVREKCEIPRPRIASVGAGDDRFNLLIPVRELLRFGKKMADVRVCPLTAESFLQNNQISETGAVSPVSSHDAACTAAAMEGKISSGVNTAVEPISTRAIKPLSKRIRDSAGRRGKAEMVREMIEEAGDDFPDMMRLGIDGNFTKNALHLAAWKGDLDSIKYLSEAGDKFGLDLVNLVSVGEGNYGKTPIFYSITQCRDDAVLLFLELGANLLIVNNKGQSPCSMAESHLQRDTCQRMYEVEAQQIENGGQFVNYRETHSDGKQYGDLDPRFCIDEDNMGDDIRQEVLAYEAAVKNVTCRQNQLLVHSSAKFKLSPVPRSLRQTTVESRRIRAKFQGVVDSARSKGAVGELNDDSYLEKAIAVQIENARRATNNCSTRKGKSKSSKGNAPSKAIADIDSLDRLVLSDVLKCSGQVDPIVVDSAETISLLQDTVDEVLMTKASILNGKSTADDISVSDKLLIALSWGMDCEWKPARKKGEEAPVATLQLSTSSRAFLVDLQKLCQRRVKDANAKMTKMELTLSQVLTQIFRDPYIALPGFGIGQDIGKLAASFPHLPCFRLFESVIDLQVLSRSVYPEIQKNETSSLQKCVAMLLGKRLDKTEQCSDWAQRPLTCGQKEYATLDAAVAQLLLQRMLSDGLAAKEAHKDCFVGKHPHLRSTVKLTFLGKVEDGQTQLAHRVSMGSVKRVLSMKFARQSWQTGKPTPEEPEEVPTENRHMVFRSENKQVKEGSSILKPVRKKTSAHRSKKPLLLSTLPGNLANLPSPGSFLGYTKDSCIEQVLGQQVSRSLADKFYLGFNRRCGIVEMSNAWLLFMNFGINVKDRKFKNEFFNQGRQITFSANSTKVHEAAFLDCIVASEAALESNHTTNILLFIRPVSNSKFLFCGECECIKREDQGDSVNLLLELLRFEELMGGGENRAPYQTLVMENGG